MFINVSNYSLSQISFDLQRQLIKHFDLEMIRDNAKIKLLNFQAVLVVWFNKSSELSSR